MTNRERFLDEILVGAYACSLARMIANGKFYCNANCTDCKKTSLEWLTSEYKEPKTDWSKVKTDTLIEVYDSGTWLKRYFAKYENNKIFAWCDGRTSKTAYSKLDCIEWSEARLVEEE